MVHGISDSPTHFLYNRTARIDSVNCLAWYRSEYTRKDGFSADCRTLDFTNNYSHRYSTFPGTVETSRMYILLARTTRHSRVIAWIDFSG